MISTFEPLMDTPNMRYCMVTNTLAALEQLNAELYNGYEFSRSEYEMIEMLVEQCNLFLEQRVNAKPSSESSEWKSHE